MLNISFMSKNQSIDKDVFKQIFIDHWDEFTKKRKRYSSEYYEEVIKKMLNCGEEFSGYSVYVCGECGGDEKK